MRQSSSPPDVAMQVTQFISHTDWKRLQVRYGTCSTWPSLFFTIQPSGSFLATSHHDPLFGCRSVQRPRESRTWCSFHCTTCGMLHQSPQTTLYAGPFLPSVTRHVQELIERLWPSKKHSHQCNLPRRLLSCGLHSGWTPSSLTASACGSPSWSVQPCCNHTLMVSLT